MRTASRAGQPGLTAKSQWFTSLIFTIKQYSARPCLPSATLTARCPVIMLGFGGETSKNQLHNPSSNTNRTEKKKKNPSSIKINLLTAYHPLSFSAPEKGEG